MIGCNGRQVDNRFVVVVCLFILVLVIFFFFHKVQTEFIYLKKEVTLRRKKMIHTSNANAFTVAKEVFVESKSLLECLRD